ncbi:MAG: non-homologous end-joining DNA ligase [Euryarchaeota archaeon]|nr:non-homologous end-joining DNA ligase [Euryarchaeota archaeon]
MTHMMLAASGIRAILKSEEYVFEPKLDGYRALCQKKAGALRFISRANRDITSEFPELAFSDQIKADCTLDGEIVIYDETGNPSFALLHSHNQHRRAPTYVAFDILELEGRNLQTLPLSKRKLVLAGIIEEGGRLQLMPSTEDGEKLWNIITARHLEGIIAKKKDSIYVSGRSRQWLKIKCEPTIDCVIVGYLTKTRQIASLALGLYDHGKLIYIGQVGTGFTESFLDELAQTFVSSSNGVVLPKSVKHVVPDKVCEVRYTEYTRAHRLRAPVFVRMRDDKPPEECTTDQVTNGA